MSFAIGSKANTRGKVAVTLPCVRCGQRVRAYRRESAVTEQRAVTACAPCHNGVVSSAEVSALVADLRERVVVPRLKAWDTEHPYQRGAEYVPGRLTAHLEAREAYRQQVWAQAVADSLAERGVTRAAVAV